MSFFLDSSKSIDAAFSVSLFVPENCIKKFNLMFCFNNKLIKFGISLNPLFALASPIKPIVCLVLVVGLLKKLNIGVVVLTSLSFLISLEIKSFL